MKHSSTSAWEIRPQDFDVFVGADTSARSAALRFEDTLTGEIQAFKTSYDPDSIVAYARKHFAGRKIAFAYETGPCGFGLYDKVVEAGYSCLVVAPSNVPSARGKRVRTDRLDAAKLARLLRGGQLTGIRTPSPVYRDLRELAHLRNTLVGEVRGCKCRIKHLLILNGLRFPEAPAGSQWSRRVMRELKDLDCSRQGTRLTLDALIEHLEWTRAKLLEAQGTLREFIDGDDELRESVEYLTSLPGVGWLIASQVVARVGDYRCIGKSEEMASFFGLVPVEDTTADRVRRGSITKGGDRRLRSMLIQGAWSAIRQDNELKAFYQRVASRQPKQKAARVAIVAVARKLAARMACVLRERRPYEARS